MYEKQHLRRRRRTMVDASGAAGGYAAMNGYGNPCTQLAESRMRLSRLSCATYYPNLSRNGKLFA